MEEQNIYNVFRLHVGGFCFCVVSDLAANLILVLTRDKDVFHPVPGTHMCAHSSDINAT